MTDRPILTVTLNPALDVAGRVDRVKAGPKLRLSDVVRQPGGGGVNVARAVHLLGGKATAFVVLGGAAGAQLGDLLAAEGIALHRFDGPGETRESLAVTDATGAQYRFVLPGPPAPPLRLLIDAIARAAPASALVVLSGSAPPGLPDDAPLQMASALPGRSLLVDTSGPALTTIVAPPAGRRGAKPLGTLRMDQAEAEAAAGQALPTPLATAGFCAGLVARGVARVVIAGRGAEGNVLADAKGCWQCVPPPVAVRSTTGAGDSFLAGFVLAQARGAMPPEALQAGTAAAAAAVMTPATDLCRSADYLALLPACRLIAL